MKTVFSSPLVAWAVLDVRRSPLEATLTAGALTVLTAFVAVILLLTQALTDTALHLLSRSPALVIRRLDAGGWAPMPEEQAVALVRRVPGVLRPRARIWGTARGPDGPLTILAADPSMLPALEADSLPWPASGEAVVGPGALPPEDRQRLRIDGQQSLTLRIVAAFPPASAMATHDLVLVTADDARRLLGLADGSASDLALDVFHPAEQQAIIPDLRRAFPFPVHIVTREQAQGMVAASHLRRGGLALAGLLPALLALILVMIGTARNGIGRKAEAGLLRCLGWTTADLFRLQLCRSVFLCLPSVAAGLATAYALVFAPGMQWAGYLLLGWQKNAPALSLSASGAAVILIQVMAMVVIPYLAAALWPAWVLAVQDPQDMLEGELLQ